MNDKDWQMLVTLAETKNLTQAALKLYVSQPALTQSLQRLEQQLGVPLFVRHNWGLTLTEHGEKAVLAAQKMLKLKRDLEADLSTPNTLVKGKILLGITNYLGSMLLAKLLPRYQRKFPNMEIEIIEASSDEMEEMIKTMKVDLGILHQPMHPADFNMIPLSEHRFVAALSANHPLAKQKNPPLDPAVLKHEPFVMLYSGQRIRQMCDSICRQCHFTPQIRMLTRSYETARNLAAAGVGVTFLPENYTRFFKTPYPPVYLELLPQIKASWTLIVGYPNKVELTYPCRCLVETLQETIHEMENKEDSQ